MSQSHASTRWKVHKARGDGGGRKEEEEGEKECEVGVAFRDGVLSLQTVSTDTDVDLCM